MPGTACVPTSLRLHEPEQMLPICYSLLASPHGCSHSVQSIIGATLSRHGLQAVDLSRISDIFGSRQAHGTGLDFAGDAHGKICHGAVRTPHQGTTGKVARMASIIPVEGKAQVVLGSIQCADAQIGSGRPDMLWPTAFHAALQRKRLSP